MQWRAKINEGMQDSSAGTALGEQAIGLAPADVQRGGASSQGGASHRAVLESPGISTPKVCSKSTRFSIRTIAVPIAASVRINLPLT